MVNEAEAHAEDDKKRRELVEAKNQAEALIHATEKGLADAGDKLPEDDKTSITGAVEALKSAVAGDDVDDIQSKAQSLSQYSMKLGEAMYKADPEEEAGDSAGDSAGAGDGAADDSAPEAAAEDTVVDADFEEVDDDQKGKGA